MMAAATAARFAMRQRMPTIKSLDAADQKTSVEPESTKSTLEDETGVATASRAPAEKPEVRGQSEERDRLMKDLDTRIVVQVGSQSNSGQTNDMISLPEPG